MKNVFDADDAQSYIARINQLELSHQPKWGKMNVAQMLAHCNVSYEMALSDQYPQAKGLKKMMMKLFVKPIVVGEKPYKKNSPTAPAFKIANERDFEVEKQRLIDYINQVQSLGANHFEGMSSASFGKLTKTEWNNMFAKHLDHHLDQFGV
ncbi:MAG: DUF1569 domain-containing protein [Putridiphycobacter sp.]|nr:DUF1569 domain-containing protein [Putridiphycobacter sp.]